jgi:hypothetical protein
MEEDASQIPQCASWRSLGHPVWSSELRPNQTVAGSLGERRAELHSAWAKFFQENYRTGNEIVHDREWLLQSFGLVPSLVPVQLSHYPVLDKGLSPGG